MAKTEIDSKAAEAANEEQVKETETQAEAEAVKTHKRRREKKRKKDFSPRRRIRKMSRSRS